MSKISKLPFIATHKLTADLKVGSITFLAMALVQDGVTRLFDASEAESGKLPEWRTTSQVGPQAKSVSGADGVRIQRNRKDVAGAELERVNEILFFVMEDGELKSTRADFEASIVGSVVDHTIPTTGEQPGDVVAPNSAVDPATTPAPDASAKKPRAPRKPKTPPASTETVVTPRAATGDKTAEKSAPAAAPAGKKHREGSIQGMTVEELRAEFTAKTGLPAPSMSVHYMRKMVMAARRGKKDFPRKTSKVPTLTLSLEDARHILDAVSHPKKTSSERSAVLEKIGSFVDANPAAEAQAAA